MKLKLERGYEFGDVLLDGTTASTKDELSDNDGGIASKTLSESVAKKLEEGKRTVRVVCSESLAESYSRILDSGEFLVPASSGMEVKQACSVRDQK